MSLLLPKRGVLFVLRLSVWIEMLTMLLRLFTY